MSTGEGAVSWLLAVVVGIVCGVAGAMLSMYVGDVIVRAYKISSFEGGSGYFVIFIILPIGFLVGLVTGIVMMRLSGAQGLGPIAVQQVLAILVTAGLLTVGTTVAYLRAPRALTVGGQTLTLQLEVRSRPVPGEDPTEELLQVSLYAGNKDNRSADVLSDRAEMREGWFIRPVETALWSASSMRLLSVTREGMATQVFELPLRSRPTRADEAWSGWQRPRPPIGRDAKLDPGDPRVCEIRYRVRFDE